MTRDREYDPYWDDPLHDERQEQRAAENYELPAYRDRPSRREAAEDARDCEPIPPTPEQQAMIDALFAPFRRTGR